LSGNRDSRNNFFPSQDILFEKIDHFHTAKAAINGTDVYFISSDDEELKDILEAKKKQRLSYLAVGRMLKTPERFS
jgi:hypothetical protein